MKKFFMSIWKWFLSLFKRKEKKAPVKAQKGDDYGQIQYTNNPVIPAHNNRRAIKEIEEEKKMDIASLLQDKNQFISDLKREIEIQKSRIEKLLRKKWYQFVQVPTITL
jgi:hypothetical protein